MRVKAKKGRVKKMTPEEFRARLISIREKNQAIKDKNEEGT